ncbi:MAG: fasciclin domain-containing protein, partial [Comamonadaceae bacterium]
MNHSLVLNRRTILLTAALAGTTTLLQACGGSDDEPQRNIVEVAQANPDLSILVEAVVAAGLAPTLSTGSLTVFAPTNAAFAALLTELGVTKEALLADKPLLTAVLTYHVLGSKVLRADVPLGKAITPVSGGFFKIESASGSLKITDGRNRASTITATDIQASNGVVHLVDRVLLPANKDIVATASALPDFSILVEAVAAAGLVTTLQGTGPFTVFAPTNAA